MTIRVRGRTPLSGRIKLSGSKNEALSIIGLSMAFESSFEISNVPGVEDVHSALCLLEECGKKVTYQDGVVCVSGSPFENLDLIRSSCFQKIRGSLFFLGPYLSRAGCMRIPEPGGCRIGNRPIDFHVQAMKAFGVEVGKTDHGLVFDSSRGLYGADVLLPFPSVGTTMNVLAMASRANGRTVISNVATEPEVIQYMRVLESLGAEFRFDGSRRIVAEGITAPKAGARHHHVSADRIEAGTYLAAALACGGSIRLVDFPTDDLHAVMNVARRMGMDFSLEGNTVNAEVTQRPKSIRLVAEVFPGFPTDLQPLFAASLCSARGDSVVLDTVFRTRFQYVGELKKLGVDIKLKDAEEVHVRGRPDLRGARMDGKDIRGTAALVVGAMSAHGSSLVTGAEHLDRGYANLLGRMNMLGADISQE